MKYLLIPQNSIVFLLMIGSLAACKDADKKPQEIVLPKTTATVTENSDAFNKSFEKLLTSYYSLKDALVEYDTVNANGSSIQLADEADLLVAEVKSDSTGVIRETAKNYTDIIHATAIEFPKEKDMEKKKKHFQQISDALYDLARTVKYNRQTIYHQHCPMPFNDDSEAWWLSNTRAIVNPYLGKKHPKYKAAMLECGDITDSLTKR